MKKLVTLFLISALVFALNAKRTLHGFTSAAPEGYTGSPSDGRTCAVSGCHAGSAVQDLAGLITSDIPASGYLAGQTYQITLMVSEAGVNEFGFSLTAEDEAGNKMGGFASTDLTIQQGGNFVTHNAAQVIATNNAKTWTVDWTAPTSGTGRVGFYASFNYSNNNNTSTGDQINTSSLFVEEDAFVSVVEKEANSFGVLVNNARKELRITGDRGNVELRIFSITGKLMTFRKYTHSAEVVSLTDLASGVYVAVISSDGDQKAAKFSLF